MTCRSRVRSGYAASAWSCVGGTQTGSSVALALGESATCTIVNDDVPATLTLVKQVVNDNGGTAAATDWTLTAAGPTTGVSGPTGDPAVTARPVSAGSYDLSESGPAGYAASAWSCVGGTQTGASVALAFGESATCTIVNDDIPAHLTLGQRSCERQRRHRSPERLDVDRVEPGPDDLGCDRRPRGDERRGAAGHLRSDGERPGRVRGDDVLVCRRHPERPDDHVGLG